MAFDLAGRVHVAVHRDDPPTDVEWRAYLDDIAARIARVDGVLAFGPGGGPTAGPSLAQQRQASAFWATQARQPPIAVVTGSRMVVRAVGALKWFMPAQIRAVGLWDPPAAWAHLGLDPRQQRLVLARLAELARGLDVTLPEGWR